MSEPIESKSCSFCARPFDDVPIVIAHKEAFICSDCVSACVGIMAKALADRAKTLSFPATTASNRRGE